MSVPLETNGEKTGSALSAWWYVVALCLPAFFVQGGFDQRFRPREPEFTFFLLADVMILFRALLGLVLQKKSTWWWVYGALYFLLTPLLTWVAALV